MFELQTDLPAEARLIPSLDTDDIHKAEHLTQQMKRSGAWIVKIGLALSTANSWQNCSELAADYNIAWLADAKLDDSPNTVASAATTLCNLEYPPAGITIHANAGQASMRAAQEIAGPKDIMMLGVTHLTSIDDEETKDTYRFLAKTLVRRRSDKTLQAGLGGLVCSGRELRSVIRKHARYSDAFTLIPGTRSESMSRDGQARIVTPYQAARDGADMIVAARQVIDAADPAKAYANMLEEVREGLLAKKRLAA